MASGEEHFRSYDERGILSISTRGSLVDRAHGHFRRQLRLYDGLRLQAWCLERRVEPRSAGVSLKINGSDVAGFLSDCTITGENESLDRNDRCTVKGSLAGSC